MRHICLSYDFDAWRNWFRHENRRYSFLIICKISEEPLFYRHMYDSKPRLMGDSLCAEDNKEETKGKGTKPKKQWSNIVLYYHYLLQTSQNSL
jgi:hypothetical protein